MESNARHALKLQTQIEKIDKVVIPKLLSIILMAI